MLKQGNAIIMEEAEYKEYRQKQEEAIKEQLAKVRVETPEKIADMSLYELNQNIIAQMKDLTPTEIKKRMKTVRSWLYHGTAKYYALICWDYNYVTIFHFPNDNYDDQIQEITDILVALGPIRAIDPLSGGYTVDTHHIDDEIDNVDAFEIWIKYREDEDPKLFMLFPYDGGIVEV